MKNVHAGVGGAGAGVAAAAAGFFGRNNGPMGPESVRVLLADPDRSKVLISNLLSERTREVRVREETGDGGRIEREDKNKPVIL